MVYTRTLWGRLPRSLWVSGIVAFAAIGLAGCKVMPLPTSAAPIRAAFYYPWFPEAWVQQGQNPFTNYSPTRGSLPHRRRNREGADRRHAIRRHHDRYRVVVRAGHHDRQALARADLGCARDGDSAGPRTTSRKVSPTRRLTISLPTFTTSSTVPRNQHGCSGLATFSGKGMPVFVYNADDLTQAKGCDTVIAGRCRARCRRVNTATDLRRPEGVPRLRHRARACPLSTVGINTSRRGRSRTSHRRPGDGSYSISPGYWKSGAPVSDRAIPDPQPGPMAASIASMDASGARWQLITTYNEWGEGTAIESASGCRNSAPDGTYCDWSGTAPSDFLADLHAVPPT